MSTKGLLNLALFGVLQQHKINKNRGAQGREDRCRPSWQSEVICVFYGEAGPLIGTGNYKQSRSGGARITPPGGAFNPPRADSGKKQVSAVIGPIKSAMPSNAADEGAETAEAIREMMARSAGRQTN